MRSLNHRGRDRSQAGIALLMVLAVVTILSLILLEFSGSTRTHLQSGVNLRAEMRATTMAETGLILTRACLDPSSWMGLEAMMDRMDLEMLCNIMKGIFVNGRVDLPIGGLSIELPDMEGIGLFKGDVRVQMKTEESYIGLAGLHCQGRGSQGANCASRRSTARKLRSMLCDPSIAHVFEKPQADGKEYTREDIIGNLVDWIDADDNRITYDPLTNQFAEGAGEGEDSYYRDLGGRERYRSKDAPFDSLQELRLIRGMNDALYDHLVDKLSVHSTGKIDVNFATADVLTALLRSVSPWFQIMEGQGDVCGQDSVTLELGENALRRYVDLIVKAREAKRFKGMMSKPFRQKNGITEFLNIVKDPLAQIEAFLGAELQNGGLAAGLLQNLDARSMYLANAGMSEADYLAFQAEFQTYADQLKDSITTESKLLRVQAQGSVGNISRRVFAVIKRDGKTVRTLYYREE